MNKKCASRVFLAFCITSALISCASAPTNPQISDEELLVTESFSLNPPAKLTRAELQHDVAILIYALQNGYGGRKYIPQDKFQKALSDFSNLSKNAADSTDTFQLCQAIAKSLVDLPDNHLAARMNGQECSSEHEKLFNGGSVGKNISTIKNRPWDLNYRKVSNKRIPVLSLTNMLTHEDQAWNGFLDTVRKLKKTAPAIIIDLRGNGGGDDTMGRDMARYLYGQDFPSPWEAIIKSQTPATYALAANSWQLRMLRTKRKGQQVADYLVKRLDNKIAEFKTAKSGSVLQEKSVPGDQGNPFDPKKGYTKPIYILIDKGCQSSCESTLEAFESHPYAITVGENTGGFIHFGNMGQLVLPHSQIAVQMATDYWKRRDGKYFEKIGYAPKIRVTAGQDALQSALDDLQKRLHK